MLQEYLIFKLYFIHSRYTHFPQRDEGKSLLGPLRKSSETKAHMYV